MDKYKQTGFSLHTVLITNEELVAESAAKADQEFNELKTQFLDGISAPSKTDPAKLSELMFMMFLSSVGSVRLPNKEVMKLLANIGGGKCFSSGINLEDMKTTYKALAALLE